jgi:carbamoyltransferase
MINKINYKLFPEEIPQGSVLGLNYSGMHDTAVALVSPEGEPLFAISLERVSRVKQDGGPPNCLLEDLPWDRIAKVAVSVESKYIPEIDLSSKTHPVSLASPLVGDRAHSDLFMQALDFIPVEKVFVPHHLSHAASAFWVSGFSSATCLVYDGGMSNEECFGGVYKASTKEGIIPIDRFSVHNYSNVTVLYSAITAILGFTPLKHEGKITGLAAYGTVTNSCRNILEKWLHHPEMLHGIFEWKEMYSKDNSPQLKAVPSFVKSVRAMLSEHSRENIAATVQQIAEEHITSILNETIKQGMASDNLCLSGGLFANVKINQRASELGFKHTFISPPMSDDGTALGAALEVASENREFSPRAVSSMSLGPSFSKQDVSRIIAAGKIKYKVSENPAKELAKFLQDGSILAIYQGKMEFGPRSLGNRSIVTNADDPLINQLLNDRLSRTEFMPFAPVCLMEDARKLFDDIDRVSHAAEFMTVTVNCSDEMKLSCPAVVHCDGTARPQLVSSQSNPFMHDLLTHYKGISGKPALVNTSFNVHEEPIVCTPEDAIKGFFESGLDVLFIEGHIIQLSENYDVESRYIREKIKVNLSKYSSALDLAEQQCQVLETQLQASSNKIDELNTSSERWKLEAKQLNKVLQSVYESLSWKVTRPLRFVENVSTKLMKGR